LGVARKIPSPFDRSVFVRYNESPARRRRTMSRMQRDATGCNNKKILPRAIDLFLCSRNDLSEKQKNAVSLLLQGLSDEQVARQVGVDRTTSSFRRRPFPSAAEAANAATPPPPGWSRGHPLN